MNSFRDPTLKLFGKAAKSPEGFSLYIPVVFTTVIFITGFLTSEPDVYGVSWHVIDLLSGLGALATFLAFRFVRSLWPRRIQMPAYVLWMISGLVANALPQIVVPIVTGTFATELLSQLPLGIIQYALLISALGVLISMRLTQLQQLKELEHQRIQLQAAEARLSSTIETTQHELDEFVTDELSTVLAELEDSLDSDQQLVALARSFRSSIDNVVRPLSHNLSHGTQAGLTRVNTHGESTIGSHTRQLTASPKSRLPLSSQLSPIVFSIAGLILITPALGIFAGPQALAAPALTFLIIGLLQLVVLKIWGSKQIPVSSTLVIATATSLCVGFLVTYPADALSLDAVRGLLLVGLVLITLLTSTLAVISARRQQAIEENQEINLKLNALVLRLSHESWLLHRRYARLVHGPIQSRLLTAALRLATGSGSRLEAISHARQDLADAITTLNNFESDFKESFVTQFTDLQVAWGGLCEIQLPGLEEVAHTLDADPVVRDCVVEVLSESVTNAVKHAEAKHVDVQITINAETVELQVRNLLNSEFVPQTDTDAETDTQQGFGSEIISEATTQWSREFTADQVTLSATFARKNS